MPPANYLSPPPSRDATSMSMNETSATSASGMSLLHDGIATLTAIHFTIIAVVAILVVIGLIWGIKAKRSRVKASRDVIANAREAGVPPVPAESDAPRAQAPETAPETAPAPVEPRETRQSQTQTRTVAPTPVPAPLSVPTPVERPVPTPIAAPQPPITDEPTAAPVAFAPDLTAEPAAPVPARPAPVAPASAQSFVDGPVTQLKGLGPKVAAQLGALGVTTIGQMAALSETEAQSIDAQLGSFTGRMGRDRWIEQARLLAAGDKAGFEAVFGKL